MSKWGNGGNAAKILDSDLLDKHEILELPRGGTSVLKICQNERNGGKAAQISKPKINWKEKFRKRNHRNLISKTEKIVLKSKRD